MLLIDHIQRIRTHVCWRESNILILVEHNLGFEAEHHERALRNMRKVEFYHDDKRQRVGVLTTLQVRRLQSDYADLQSGGGV